KIGKTEYVLSLIPLGGYVKLLGEVENEKLSEEDEKMSFSKQPVWKRIMIVFAGPFFNFLLAVLIFVFVYIYGVPTLSSVVGEVQKDSAAYQAGILQGDKIVSIDSHKIVYWDDIKPLIIDSQGKELEIVVDRGGQVKQTIIKPRLSKTKNIFGEEVSAYLIGISPSDNVITEKRNLWEASIMGLQRTWQFSKLTIVVFVKMLKGDVSPRNLGGPIFIAQAAGAVAKEGIVPFLFLMALLSVNLAIINLFPIPILDGGHIMFNIIELIRRKPLSLKWQGILQQIGFVFLIMLMIFVVMVDIERMNLKFVNEIVKYFK
ncbi:MAG: RIP metalloprotease RseP, partial [Deltaproteobacteria bacterium RBG_19FT_COMBO_43_11]